uniref:Interleukin 18 receptor 1 n=1 Tax=Anabas testudineus TaxID=64144 RepID=A0A3Q1IQS8_ANATE
MMVNILPVALLPVLTLLTGVSPLKPEEIYVKTGEMVVLHCPHSTKHNHNDNNNVVWTSYTTQEMYVINNKSAGQKQMLIAGRSLVILIASVNHEGNYSCSVGNASSQFRLTVYNTQSTENEERNKYSKTCYAPESCTLSCPEVNIPDVNTLNMTSNPITWHRQGDSSSKDSYFSSVEKEDHGVYTCTRSYQFQGQLYNMTFTVILDVQPQKKSGKPMILSPYKSDVFYVDLGSTVVIDCKAVVHSDFDEVFWLSDTSFVETNDSFPIFYNYTMEDNNVGIDVTASLVFKKVSEEDLSRRYTCKLESASELSSFVTVTLASKVCPLPLLLALGIVGILVVVIIAVVYAKFKIHIALFIRDNLGCHSSTSDRKNYDAFLMCYGNETDAGLNEDNRQWLKSVLEEKFGYCLCLYNRKIIPGKAEAQAVLDCIEQSQKVVLVPTTPDCGLGSDVLNDIHLTLVQRQSHLVFIKTEKTKVPSSGSVPEALKLLGETDFVTWKGSSSMIHTSSFFKELRYYLPAPHSSVSKVSIFHPQHFEEI